jgi:hypothetical protein
MLAIILYLIYLVSTVARCTYRLIQRGNMEEKVYVNIMPYYKKVQIYTSELTEGYLSNFP